MRLGFLVLYLAKSFVEIPLTRSLVHKKVMIKAYEQMCNGTHRCG